MGENEVPLLSNTSLGRIRTAGRLEKLANSCRRVDIKLYLRPIQYSLFGREIRILVLHPQLCPEVKKVVLGAVPPLSLDPR